MKKRKAIAALAGLLAAGGAIALGSGVATIVGAPTAVESVGNTVIDAVPPQVKDLAIEQLGSADKPVLIGSVLVVVLGFAALAGVLGLRRPKLAYGLLAALGGIALLAAMLDRTSTSPLLLAAVPAVLTAVVAIGLLRWFLSAIGPDPQLAADAPAGFDRRAFVAAAMAASAAMAAGGGATALLGSSAGAKSRAALRLPRAARPATPLADGVQSPVKGVSSFITKNADFYRVDTALRVPQVAADTYRLRIGGMVERALNLSFEDLLAERLVERRITLTCVSNPVGGPYVGTASWLGVPVSDLLKRAGVDAGADAVKSTSADNMTIGTPLDVLTDPDRGALIAVGMNGEPLPVVNGFPVRMVVPGLYGYVSATKWLTDLEVTRFADFKAYWSTRGYSEQAPIKLSSRIDVPKAFNVVKGDQPRFGGVAWAQSVGVRTVEVKIDDGDWVEADLAEEDTIDTWRQWSYTWTNPTPGSHQISVRATNADGLTQTSDRAAIAPNGSTGWHSVRFRVA